MLCFKPPSDSALTRSSPCICIYQHFAGISSQHLSVHVSRLSIVVSQAVLQSGLVCMCLQEDRKSQRSQPKEKKGFDHKIEGVFVRKSNKKENPRVVSRIFGRRQFIFAAFFLLRKSRTIKNCCVYEFESRVSCLVFSSYSLMTHISIRLSIILVSPHVYMHALSRHAATITDR